MPTTGTMRYLKIGDATYEVYDTNEDTKVYQSYKAASGYSYWRPLVIGYSSGLTEGFTPADQTNLTYTFNTLTVQPSTGTIRFGAAALTDSGYTNTISADTLTANRTLTAPDKSGTIAVTSDLHNVPSGGSSGQVLTKASGTDYDLEWTTVSSGGGSVTSVGLTNATNSGLTISGSPITSSGSITVGHSNVLTSAQTTQAVYPIKIDKNGHISEYGSAVSITDNKVSTAAVTDSTTYYPIVGTNTTSATTKFYDSTGFEYSAFNGTTEHQGGAGISLGNSTATGTAGNKKGFIIIYGTGSNSSTLYGPSGGTGSYNVWLPNNGGTLALTTDIPTAGTGLSKSGTTLNHSNSVTAQTTQAVYPIKIDAQGHISAYGSAITIPTTAADVGAVPTTRTVNGKALSSDITLSASDVSALPSSTVIPTITDTYSGTSSNGMSGKAVKSAIDALDGTVTGTAGAGKTLTAFSQTDGKVSATFGNISITKSQISDFPTIPTKTSDLINDSGYITGVTSTSTPTASTIAKFDSSAHMNSTDMTSTEVSNFVDSLTYSGVLASDYIVLRGTDGTWLYRKWNSGICEAWATISIDTLSTWSASGNLYRAGPVTQNMPSNLFVDIPTVSATHQHAGVSSMSITDVSSASLDFYFFRGSNTSASNVSVHLYCIGKWK